MFGARDQICELRVAVERAGDDGVAIYYELRNHSDGVVFVFDGVPPQEAPFYVERAGNALMVSQKVIAPPRGLLLERPEVPLASRVDPGLRLRHKLELKLPLREAIPYPHLQPRREGSEGYLILDTSFEIGYFAAPDPDAALPAGESWVFPGLTAKEQALLRAGPIGRMAFDPARR